MALIKIGDLRHRVSIQSKIDQNEFTRTSATTWTETETRYASVVELSGRELEQSKQQHEEVNIKIIMRKIDISSEQRIVFGTRIFNVLGSTTDKRSRFTFIMCKERK